MARLGLEGFDILNDVRCSPRKRAHFRNKIRNAKDIDEDYQEFLMLVLDDDKESTNEGGNEGLAVVRDKLNHDVDEYEDEDEDEDDPDYKMFLANIKPKGNSYVLKIDRSDGFPVFVEYEKEDGSDEEYEYLGRGKQQDAGDEKDLDKVESQPFLKKKKKKGLTSKKNSTKGNDASSKRQGKDEKRKRSSKEQTARKGRKSSAIVTVDEDVAITVKEEIADVDEASFKSGHSFECKAAEDDLQIIASDNCTFGKEGSSILINASSAKHCENVEDICPLQTVDCDFVSNVKALLQMPYNQEEYIRLWELVKIRKPILKNMDLRNGKFYSSGQLGRSYLDHHEDLREKLKEVDNDNRQKLNILRGFFFWLQNLTQEGAFKPWTNPEWLSLVDKSSVPALTFSD
ncbi:hypothetical protein K7X08_014075 [Anisodus acutangulus]|uniref:Uncharacterized protein n=1 Tax=Anisodus acutangulus TaxID=402998 RepID=A0A9Q1LMR9_9SOLA|nr:hypothetical protein K7X08_014075 [Anisodus acutangulus]